MTRSMDVWESEMPSEEKKFAEKQLPSTEAHKNLEESRQIHRC